MYLYLKILAIIFFLLIQACNSKIPTPPLAQKGILDLREWDFSKNGAVDLHGEWGFVFGDFIHPKDVKNKFPNFSYIQVPSRWEESGYPLHGHATYILKILFSKDQINSIPIWEIDMTDASSSYYMYWQEKLILTNGKPAKTKEETISFRKHQSVKIEVHETEIYLVFHVANFIDNSSGLWNKITFGKLEEIEAGKLYRFGLKISTISILFIMGLYHLGLFYFRKKDISAFYFGCFCLSILVRSLSIDERYIIDLFPFLPYWIVQKLELLSFYVPILLFTYFIHILFPDEFSLRAIKILQIFLIPAIGLVIFFPFVIYVNSLKFILILTLVYVVYSFYVVFKAMYNRRMGARLFFTGYFLFSVSIVNDIFIALGLIHAPFLTSFGLVIFLFFQAVLLSRRFAYGFLLAEKLAEDLNLLNQELEYKVKEKTKDLEEAKTLAEREFQKSEQLLLNILPKEVAKELKEQGYYEPRQYDSVCILFSDFANFTKITELLTPSELVRDLSVFFTQFDKIIEHYNLEKLKTIGDGYMCAAGIPHPKKTKNGNYAVAQAIDTILAGLEMLSFIELLGEFTKSISWNLRIGIHTGPLIAGVIGEKKFIYDVWGDTVNIASRMESSGSIGKINVSGTTKKLTEAFFDFEYRGKILAKNKGKIEMYYVMGIKKELAGKTNLIPSEKFWNLYNEL